jgi:diguanylate cyclase (GGDEF)-like protein
MIDLDKFKEVNDTYGHQAGDEVLRVTANRLLKGVRREDTVARIGGDEFVVLVPELNDLQAVEVVAAKIVQTLALPVPINGHLAQVSVSVGVCAATGEHVDADDMLRDADVALYHAKKSGRNRFHIVTVDKARVQAS